MKNNLKNRLTAFLLCLAMLFSVACAAKDPTQSSTPTTSASGEAEAPSVAPENGAEKIVGKTLKLYHTAQNVQDLTLAHYESTPEILLIDTETMCREFIDAFLGGNWKFTYE